MLEILLGAAAFSSQFDYEYISKCSKNVHPVTISAIIEAESAFNPYAIGINSGKRLSKQPSSFEDAVILAENLINQGHNIDMGLGQINSNNLKWLNLSIEDVFNPCKNISAMDYVITHNYKMSYDENSDYKLNLKKAVSMYNTGSPSKGFSNGYVARVDQKAIDQLKNIPLGAEREVNFTVEKKRRSKPLEMDSVDSFKSYNRKSINNHDDENDSRKRSEHSDDVQQQD